MTGLDDWLAHLAAGGGPVLALAIAVLLGLRHATDPDHLTAVSTLVLSDEPADARRAGRLGLAWGSGHATTLLLFGLPAVLFGRHLPERVQQAAELAVGVVIVVLAVRLLVRWRRGRFHAHVHAHGEVRHVHPHVHADAAGHGAAHAHEHPHAEGLGRSPRAAFGIGLLHGAGGSAGVAVLLVASMPGRGEAAAALILFAGATAASMCLVSWAWGGVVRHGPSARRLGLLAPALGTLSLLFGAWYGLAALG